MRSRLLALLALCAAPAAAHADGDVFKIDAPKSTLQYKIVHKFHEVEAKTSTIEGAILVKGDAAQVQVRADTGSFDSGNANRDAHMKETVEADKFPKVTFKGVLKGFKTPDKFPATVQASADGKLDFHGKTNPLTVPVTLTFDDATHVHATAEFDVSLDAHGVDRPSLMFVKIDDACHMKADLRFAR